MEHLTMKAKLRVGGSSNSFPDPVKEENVAQGYSRPIQ